LIRNYPISRLYMGQQRVTNARTQPHGQLRARWAGV
jgi:hypothetical protein